MLTKTYLSRSITQMACSAKIVVLALFLTALALTASAQTATVQGNLSSMDVINDTGQLTHGFEIEIEGAQQGDLYYTGYGQRYGAGIVTTYATGVRVRWASLYNPGTNQYSQSTPQYTPGTPVSWQYCYQAGAGYSSSGCENFGQGMRNISTITLIRGYWLIDDPANPGSLIRYTPNVAVPLPNWFFSPPAAPSTPPVVVAVVEAPEAPEVPQIYGTAQWLKIYTTQLPRALTETDLQTGGGTVPQDPAQVEVAWDIIQADPLSGGNGRRSRNRKQNSTIIATATRSIIRRYETYKYTGGLDAITKQVACADLTCTAPSAGELGDQIAGANAAVNVIPDSVVITKSGTGGGNVDSADKFITCGNKCGSTYIAGTNVTLTAKPNSGSTFAGWSGACAGTSATCTVAANGAVAVGATFTANTPTGGGGGTTGVLPDLQATARASTGSPVAGALFTLFFGVKNAGTVDATGATFTAVLTDSLTLFGMNTGVGNQCTITGRTITCLLVTVPAGQTRGADITVFAPLTAMTVATTGAFADSNGDSNLTNNAATVTVNVRVR